MKSIVHIKKNTICTDNFTKDAYCQVVQVSEPTLLDIIGETLQMTADSIADTETCYETETELYQMIYIVSASKPNQGDLNSIATMILSSRTTPVFGDVVILKYKIHESQLELDTCTLEDVETVFQKQISKTCIYVRANGQVELKSFQSHPLEQETDKNVKLKEIPFYNHHIEILLKENADQGINNRVSQLVKMPVSGEAYITWKSDKNIYGSLSQDLFDKMSCLLADGLDKYKITESDKIRLRNQEEYINIFRVIQSKYQQYKWKKL